MPPRCPAAATYQRGVTVELVVPREAEPELRAGLAKIGRWVPEREPAALPTEVRVEVAITG